MLLLPRYQRNFITGWLSSSLARDLHHHGSLSGLEYYAEACSSTSDQFLSSNSVNAQQQRNSVSEDTIHGGMHSYASSS